MFFRTLATLVLNIVFLSCTFATDNYLITKDSFLKATNFNSSFYPMSKRVVGEFYQTTFEVEKCKFKTFKSLDAISKGIDGSAEPVVWTETMVFKLNDLNLDSIKIYNSSRSLWINTINKQNLVQTKSTEPGHPGWDDPVDFTAFFFKSADEKAISEFKEVFIKLMKHCQTDK